MPEVNDNPYSGQPTYSRDVCDLMRRINALEARASIPLGQYYGACDFDISDGRVYVLGWAALVAAEARDFRIYVHDQATGAPVKEFAVPLIMEGWPVNGTFGTHIDNLETVLRLRTNAARPRMCAGGGYIYMAGTWFQQKTMSSLSSAFIRKNHGTLWRFTIDGEDITESPAWEHIGFDYRHSQAGGASARNSVKGTCFGGIHGFSNHGQDPLVSDTIPAASQQIFPVVPQLHYLDDTVYGLAVPPLGAQIFSYAHLCYARGDFSEVGWIKHSEDLVSYGPGGPTDISSPVYIGIASRYSRGAMAVHDGRLYFDCSRGVEDDPDAAASKFFGGIVAANHGEGEAEFVHNLFDLLTLTSNFGATNNVKVHPHALYATDGVYLFAWHDSYDIRYLNHAGPPNFTPGLGLRRYELVSGAFLDGWDADDGIGPVLQMRVYDGVLWLLYANDPSEPGGQPKIEARDPATMAVISSFFVGVARAQREFMGYTATGPVSLGTPDGGVAIPDLEALTPSGVGAIKSAAHIIEMREALAGIAPYYIGPSGERLHVNGSDDDENLYLLAMGDRTKYGATGGPRTTWTRSFDQMQNTSVVSVEDAPSYAYICIFDHVSTAADRPHFGGQSATYWRATTEEELEALGYSTAPDPWAAGAAYGVKKTYDIDIGEILECVTILEGSTLASGVI